MPNLLTCLSEPGIAPSCCETPYQPVMSDCVLDCLVREQQRVTRSLRVTYGGMLEFGTRGYEVYENQVQDMQLLTTFLYDLFLERVASVAAGNADWVVSEVWEQRDMSCVADYFRCRYKLDIRPWLLHIGLYDPAHPPTAAVIAQLPIPYEVPCGTNLPVPPDPDPPLEEDCIIPTFMVVSGAVDSAYEASADPLSTYLIVTNLLSGIGGWNDHVATVAAPGNFITPPDPSNIAIQGSDQIWVVSGGSAQALFPIINGTVIGQSLTLSITPVVSAGMTLLLEVSDGTTFETVYNGDPSALATNYDLVMSGAILVRARYTYQGCVYGPFDTDLDNGCGDLQVAYEAVPNCGSGNWSLELTVAVLDSYAGGTATPSVNGNPQASIPLALGVTSFGPYAPNETVYVRINHPSNPACRVDSQDFTDPTPVIDPAIYLPVLFTQNTLTLVYVATIPVIHPSIVTANPDIRLVYDCGSGDVEFYNGPINSFVPTPVLPQPSCNANTIEGAIIYASECDVRVDADVDTYTPTGPIDPGFAGRGFDFGTSWFLEQPGGKMLVCGSFGKYNPLNIGAPYTSVNRFTRLNRDGTLDTAYNDIVNDPLLPETGGNCRGFNARVDQMAKNSRGEIVLVGPFTKFNNVTANGIVRLLPDGSRDTSFDVNAGTAFSLAFVTGVVIDASDGIICTGIFSSYNGTAAAGVIRLNDDGTPDTVFIANCGTGFASSPYGYRVVMNPDGTLVLNSSQPQAHSFDGQPIINTVGEPAPPGYRKTLIRLKSTGGLDAVIAQGDQIEEFSPPTSNRMVIQPDGKIIVVGSFTKYDTVTVGRILRLNPNGTPDTTFMTNAGAGFDRETSGAFVLPSGKILIGTSGGAIYTDVSAVPRTGAHGWRTTAHRL